MMMHLNHDTKDFLFIGINMSDVKTPYFLRCNHQNLLSSGKKCLPSARTNIQISRHNFTKHNFPTASPPTTNQAPMARTKSTAGKNNYTQPKQLILYSGQPHPYRTIRNSDNSDRGESPSDSSGDRGEESPTSSPNMATLKEVSPKKKSPSSGVEVGADKQVCVISLFNVCFFHQFNAFLINSSYH